MAEPNHPGQPAGASTAGRAEEPDLPPTLPWIFGGASNPELLDEALQALEGAGTFDDASDLVFTYGQRLGTIDKATLQDAFQRWMDPAPRWQPLVDIVEGTQFPRDEDVRRVPAILRRLDSIRDTLPTGQTVHDGTIYGNPGDRSLMMYSFPDTVNDFATEPGEAPRPAPAFTMLDPDFHEYWAGSAFVPAGLADAAMAHAVETPTAGPDNWPATTIGTDNDVGRLYVPTYRDDPFPYIVPFPVENLVKSYYVPSYDPSRYSDIVVNETIRGYHGMQPGVVVRGITHDAAGNDMLTSYGMGTTPWMSMLRDAWYPGVNRYWTPLNQRAVDAAAGRR